MRALSARPKPQAFNEEGRPTTERPTKIFNSSNAIEYNQRAFQAQRLIDLYQLRPERAQLVATLVFGGCNG